MKNKFIIVLLCVSILNIFNLKEVSAKYVYVNTENIFKIQTADNTCPTINDRNYNVYNETFNTNIAINFSDNLGIEYAKYWFKEDSFCTEEDLKILEANYLEAGVVFEKSGYYMVEVSDLYNNKTQYSFMIDKEVNNSEISVISEDDTQVNLNVYLKDSVSGLQRADVYVDNEIYKTYDYSTNDIKEKTEEILFLKTDIKFYQEIYVVCHDNLGNSKKSESVILNQDKIYDIEDLYRFNKILNNGIYNFSNKTVYLINSLDLSDVKEEWKAIKNFRGTFDGKNCTISGFYMNTDVEKSGFFAENYGVIKNFTVSGEINVRADISAGICAENFGRIEKCRSRVTVNSTGNYAGGITGINYGEIVLCKNNYPVIIQGNYAGGIAGYNEISGVISKCGSSGDITSNQFAGGVCGFTEANYFRNVIELSFSMGTITANLNSGGLCGGTANDTVKLAYVYNTGEIVEKYGYGRNGGIVGGNSSNIYINNSYNIGKISSSVPNEIAPLSVKVEESYYMEGRENASGSGTSKNSSLFKEAISNTNSLVYDLSKNAADVWIVAYGHNDGYPLFAWQLQ